ncbi:hypothetical protein PUNSTDRAFT_119067 [Punctularia strigosozonata HHB-11173 SS5]|uniref:uncharacterized protein n=1 Tax=Punctularia strigosozonata (strain HHB-11173) TaxID=741275 RepID=UPI0004417A61|nr:uncharacterized protein PUNSTDRAFT_119067 [Punctularia strigosozonata HHB-11173 SS5]EIN11840.1 hypothetical protein PUNSTDRAFT_119067 [Punctularia strigosozonata HHB-11173 SS5]
MRTPYASHGAPRVYAGSPMGPHGEHAHRMPSGLVGPEPEYGAPTGMYRAPSTSEIPAPVPGPSTRGARYDCSYCGKTFNRPSSLKIHINSHTKEKPFQCPVEGCGRAFSVLSNMRRHARVHSQPKRPRRGSQSSAEGSSNPVTEDEEDEKPMEA